MGRFCIQVHEYGSRHSLRYVAHLLASAGFLRLPAGLVRVDDHLLLARLDGDDGELFQVRQGVQVSFARKEVLGYVIGDLVQGDGWRRT